MSKRKLTLFEYHNHAPMQLFGDRADASAEEQEETEEDTGRSVVPVIALVVLLSGAIAYRYIRSESEDTPVESEPVEVTEYEN